jgi:hypothetical protein
MIDEPLEPCELVLELGTRPRVPVWKVKAADQDSVDGCLDITALVWIGGAGQSAPRFVDFADPA